MEIKLRGLKQTEHNLTFSEPPEIYSLDETIFAENLNSEVTVGVQGKNYYIKIFTNTDVKFECDLCLEDYISLYEVKTVLVYTEDPNLDPENEQDDLFFLPKGQDVIDLTKDIKQNLQLNIPMKKICKENCKGLCSECGINLNNKKCDCLKEIIDPRWDALKEIQNNTD
ncbi:DUF177 domain-containing protein [candidate division KSB1 bacterium]